jgi:hypothetical protein
MSDGGWGVFVIGLAIGVWLVHDTEILRCRNNLQIDAVEKVAEYLLPNGLLEEDYDRNGDGTADILTLSYVRASHPDGQIDHDPHPVFYIADLDFDGNADVVYIDKYGAGQCEDIVLYRDLRVPAAQERLHLGGMIHGDQ